MNKKLRIGIGFLMASSILIFSKSPVFAYTNYLDYRSPNTYVMNEHEDGLHDTYYGHLAIWGFDRFGKFGEYYPTYSRITYRLRGENTRYYLYSDGENDSKKKTRTVTFKDKWDFGKETEAFGQVGISNASNSIMSDGVIDE